MKQGSRVHEKLEKEVHTYVPIEVTTKEDIWGLKIWNVIQGLRGLRATGMTRELQVWGVVDGEVVIGIIDELSYTCPDEELEAAMEHSNEVSKPGSQDQKSIKEFYASQSNATSAWLGHNPYKARKVYVTDVKTRGAKSMPSGAALKGVQMQLMLYHRLLLALASNTVPADTIFSRYNLDANAPFTETFVKNIAALDDNFIHDTNVSEDFATFNKEDDNMSELWLNNSLTRLWSLMIMEFQRTFPTPISISNIVQAEYRKGHDGTIIGNQCFVYDDVTLHRYLEKTMDWWTGKREARGVDVEEAFKCQTCEFAEGCEWRKEKMAAVVQTFREKKRVGGKKWKV